MSPVVAVVGATGVVGRQMLKCLAHRAFPASRVIAMASARSAGTEIEFGDGKLSVIEATPDAFSGVDIALFSAGASTSREFAPAAVAHGAVVIDNSSAWRMDPDVPLVVPEVNPHHAANRPKGIIANPNCSTIQMVVALQPLHHVAGIKHIVVSTYQAASGKGHKAVAELAEQTRALVSGQEPVATVFPGVLAQNLLIDWPAGPDEYTEEEMKMVNETRKIFDDQSIGISPTTVRVPVATGHSEALYVTFHKPLGAKAAKDLLRGAPGVLLMDEPFAPGRHPQPAQCVGRDEVFVGRVRDDLHNPGALQLWVVSDNLLKGAALNAVQISELISL